MFMGPATTRASGTEGRLLLWLLLGLGVCGWIVNAWPYISDDSFFYSVIARNIALHGEHSFSRLVPTNGIHPLWLYVLTAYSAIVAAVNPALLYSAGYAVTLVALISLAGMLVWMRVAHEYGLNPALMVGPSLVFLLGFGVLYSEAHVVFLCLGAMFLVVARCRERPGGLFWIGLMGGITILARLDAIFIVVPVLVGVAIERPSVLRRGLTLGLGASVLLVPYLASNAVYFGGLMPVSGWMKSSFPVPYLKGLKYLGISTTLFGYTVLCGIVPMLAGAFVLLWGRPPERPRRDLLLPLLVGTSLHLAYVALFTRSHTGWFWYYVPHVALLGVSVAVLFQRVRGAARLAWLMSPLLAVQIYLQAREPAGGPEQLSALRLIERSGVGEGAVLVGDWPGYVAFRSQARVFAVDLLTANRKFYARMRASENALDFILAAARETGHPIEAIVCNGNLWLVPSADGHSLTYYDPRRYPVQVAIGWAKLGDQSPEVDGLSTLWRLTSTP